MSTANFVRTLLVGGSICASLAACSSEADPPLGTGGTSNAGTSGNSGVAGAGAPPVGQAGTGTSGSGTGGSGGGTGGQSTGGTDAAGAGAGGVSGGGAGGTAGAAGGGGGGAGGAAGGAGGTAGSGGAGGSGGASGGGGSGGGAASGSPGCGKAAPTRPDPKTQQTITVNGVTRYYLLYVPTNYDSSKPLPVVYGIHGLNMNNVWAAHDASGFQLIQETKDAALLIYPQGLPANGQSTPPSSQSQWGNADSNWGGPPPSANAQKLAADLAFFDAVQKKVEETYCVNTQRVYAVGFSQGGFMTNTLGCERASVFKALAPVAGWGPNASNPTCSNAAASQPLLQTQGTADTTVSPALGESTRNFWLMRNGCTNTTQPSATYGNGCVEYQGCMPGKPVIYCTHGGGHSVPSGAGPRAWKFFQAQN